ncbi:hypothetical protein L596_012391 [Steinernema carpocapsae]|uniref:WAP domain-containing protein n=1 Tax=Steinernema carpocapsae TaxID=34508 RepID=A0A4U5NWY1_STECR|nr:hypothetical protein L596_012391 [Steinernema carpocapsae]
MSLRVRIFVGFCLLGLAIGADREKKYAMDVDWNVCVLESQANVESGFGLSSFWSCQDALKKIQPGTCVGPKTPTPRPRKWGSLKSEYQCPEVTCPSTHYCSDKYETACCLPENDKIYGEAMSDKCPDGSKAYGFGYGTSFKPLLASNCKDMICYYNCVQVNKHFAKCCMSK